MFRIAVCSHCKAARAWFGFMSSLGLPSLPLKGAGTFMKGWQRAGNSCLRALSGKKQQTLPICLDNYVKSFIFHCIV